MSDQPAAVEAGVGEFVQVLIEALVIVLLVSFFSLGARTGLVVALSIPLVLAMTFALMHYFDIGLHKISLGALVLALGLMVDDAIIAVEMMAIKMEQGFSRLKAASSPWMAAQSGFVVHKKEGQQSATIWGRLNGLRHDGLKGVRAFQARGFTKHFD